MSDSTDLEADLMIALQTLDTASFKEILQHSSLELVHPKDQNQKNIFHEFAKVEIRERLIFDFLEIIISYFYRHYGEKAPATICHLLNSQTLEEKLTPLHLAVKSGKLVMPT